MYHIVLRCLFHLCFLLLLLFSLLVNCSQVRVSSKLLCLKASLYSWDEASNVCLLHESLLIRLLMDEGSCFTIAGGWFERRLMYKGSSLDFLYGLYVPSVKSSVMSKKFTRLRFAVAVILSPNLLKVSISCFLALSARNHTKSLANKKYSKETKLSKPVWELKAAKKPFTIKWSLLKKVPAYKAGSRRCNLCLEEKLTIMKNKDNALLNKRTELFTKCRHETRYLVSNCK